MSDRWDNPEEWNAYLAEGNARQPRKRVAADVLLRDAAGRIMLVDPSYKPDWDLPGGMAEANESPRAAAARELREELGLQAHIGPLLVTDWVPPHGPWDDSIAYIFDGGVLPEQEIQAINMPDGELRGFRFCNREDIEQLVRPRLWRRLKSTFNALASGDGVYLEDGLLAPGMTSRQRATR